jgi:DNA-binding response OmpR family regulator
MSTHEGFVEVRSDRRSRPKKGLVVFIDEDSRTCDHVAFQLERDGYHVLTAEGLLDGLILVSVRPPDAVVWSDGAPDDDPWDLWNLFRSQLPTQTRAIIRCDDSSTGWNSEARARTLGVTLIHRSTDPGQLAAALHKLLDDLC